MQRRILNTKHLYRGKIPGRIEDGLFGFNIGCGFGDYMAPWSFGSDYAVNRW